MSYTIEKGTGDVVISGFEKGIGDDPYEGLGNVININTTSIPKEASVNFATSQISPPTIANGSVISANGVTHYLTYTGAANLENYMTIVFSSNSGLSVSNNTSYWIKNLGGAGAGTFQITSDYLQTSVVNVTNGTGTFAVAGISVGPIDGGSTSPKFFTYDAPDNAYFMLTGSGDLWSNIKTTTSGYWTYCGVSGTAQTNQGSGLAYYQSFNGQNAYVFVFRLQTIDYFQVKTGGNPNLTWVFGWKPSDGSGSNAGATLNTSTEYHNAYVGQDNVLYWCDGSFLGSVFETPDGPPQTIAFDPTSTATYTYAKQALALPVLDQAQCLAELGVNLLIGGKNNAVYPWNRTSTSFSYPILLAEYNVQQLVTVNTSTYIFVGNRGNIWITNGSQANPWKKIPDFISKTVEPYYTWGGVSSKKKQLYFSFNVKSNAGATLPFYGGVWSVDLDTKAIRFTNTLSYQTTAYNGYSTAMIQNFSLTAPGTGLYIGWDNNAAGRGIDTTTSAPYSGSTAVSVGIVDSDLIPIGTFLKPMTNGRAEFKLSVPLVTNESVQLFYRQKFSDSFTAIGDAITASTSGFNGYSWAYTNVPFQQSQWVQIRAVLISTASSPSYNRLTELRLGQ